MNALRQTLALILLVAAVPLLALISTLLWFLQGRPVLFHQNRSGRDGVLFRLVKFRSMRDTRDAAGTPLPDAQRVTHIGNFLRKTRLDELPSLWNVITGDLAFIGPRPLLPETIIMLGPPGDARGQVLPGLTGWSQVNGNTLLTLDEKVALDLWYINHRTFRLDGAIILRTLMVMARGEKRRTATARGPIDQNAQGDGHSTTDSPAIQPGEVAQLQ
jgi:lipopolysaccharide/colanic/teichoic acid biosynthesis glycosyltransferase